MLYEYGLEPEVLSNWQSFRYFYEKFGVEHGRIISRFPKKWTRMVYEACSKCAEVERKKIEEGLANIKTKLLSSNREYNDTIPWLDNAEAQHQLRPFHAIIAGSNPRKRPEVLISEELAEKDTPLWTTSRECIVPRNAAEMASCVRPLLQACSEILFVDPHFSPTASRYLHTFEQFVLAVIGNTKIRRIEYHLQDSEDKPSKEFFEQKCEKLTRLLPKGMDVSFIRWKQVEGKEDLHPRYILTDIGGVRIEHGLDEGEEGETTDISLLDYPVYSKRWKDFQRDSSPYEYVDEVNICGKLEQIHT